MAYRHNKFQASLWALPVYKRVVATGGCREVFGIPVKPENTSVNSIQYILDYSFNFQK